MQLYAVLGMAALASLAVLVVFLGGIWSRARNQPDGETRTAAHERAAAVHAAGDFGGARWVTSHRRTGGWR